MTPRLLHPAMRLVLGYLLLTVIVLLLNEYMGHSLRNYVFVGGATIFSTYVYLRYLRLDKRILSTLDLIDRHAILLLAVWIIIYLTWCGLVLFANPFRFELNQGDAVFYVQTLWNLVNGMNPENSFFTMNGTLLAGDDPRYANTFGYVSIFALHQYWLPMAVLTPLYALFPQPPMHLFALQISVIAFGLPGVYWAVRQAGGSKKFAVLSAIGYSLLPQIETQLFFKGYFDVFALGVMPWLFGALFGKKWGVLYIFTVLVALISYPHTYFVVIFGLSILIFFRAIVPGTIVMLIGWLALKLDTAVYVAAISPYLTSPTTIPSFLQAYVLDRTIGSLGYNVKVNSAYVIMLLQGLAFIPLIAIRRKNQWDNRVIGLWAVVGGAFVLNLFRSAGWEFPRNSFFIAPLFFMSLMGCININREFENTNTPLITMLRDAPNALLFFAMASMIFVGGALFNSPPLASHFPWGRSSQILVSEDTRAWNAAMKKLSTLVPQDASIAWRAGDEVHAYLANRKHSWFMGREPEGVRYYVFIGNAPDADHLRKWLELISRLKQQPNMKILFSGVEGKQLLVFENQNWHEIPRDERLLGWNLLGDAFSRKKP